MSHEDERELARIVALTKPHSPMYPWYSEADQFICQEQLERLYRDCAQKRPQFAWCSSPAAMFQSHFYLREMQTKTRQATIQALIPYTDRIETGAKHSFMEAVMDKDITVSVGAPMKSLFRWQEHHQYDNLFRSIESLPSMHGQFQTSQKVTTPATAWDAVLYPGEYLNCIGPTGGLGSSIYAIMPFVKLCWICKRPMYTRQNPDGFLHAENGEPAMEFEDGFAVFAKHVEEEAIIDGEYLEVGEETRELPAHKEE
jgi:hypothetical protein